VLITAYSSNGQTANDQAMQLLRAEARSLLWTTLNRIEIEPFFFTTYCLCN
jgi:hypothetical protein